MGKVLIHNIIKKVFIIFNIKGGGAIAIEYKFPTCSLIFTESYCIGNTAMFGGVFDLECINTIIQIKNIFFDRNNGYYDIGKGGGGSIIMIKGDVTTYVKIENNIFMDCLGSYENPVYSKGAIIQFWGYLEDNNSLFINNQKCFGGCAIFFMNFGRAKLLNTKFIANSASDIAGAVGISQNCNINFNNCIFLGCTSKKGGVVQISERSNVVFNNSNFTNNSAISGGLFHCYENYDSEIVIILTTFSGNSAIDNLFNLLTIFLRIISSYFYDNINTLFSLEESSLLIEKVEIFNHFCNNFVIGCALNAVKNSKIFFTFVNFSEINNIEEEGNIFLEFSYGEFYNLYLTNMRDQKKQGSCFNLKSSKIILNNSFFSNYDFNCIYGINVSLYLDFVFFDNRDRVNETLKNDNFNPFGSIYCENCLRILIFNCMFIMNKNSYYGGALSFLSYDENSELTADIFNCSFHNNEVLIKGGSIYLYGVNSNISKCSFKQNKAYIGGGIVFESLCKFD